MTSAVADPPAFVARTRVDTIALVPHDDVSPEPHDARAALEAATQRWVAEGDTPENVAAYAHALRSLLGEL
jgi:hypothetical protein